MVGRRPMGRAEGRQDQGLEEGVVPVAAVLAAAIAAAAIAATASSSCATSAATAISCASRTFILIPFAAAAVPAPQTVLTMTRVQRPPVLLEVRQQFRPLLPGQWLRLLVVLHYRRMR